MTKRFMLWKYSNNK